MTGQRPQQHFILLLTKYLLFSLLRTNSFLNLLSLLISVNSLVIVPVIFKICHQYIVTSSSSVGSDSGDLGFARFRQPIASTRNSAPRLSQSNHSLDGNSSLINHCMKQATGVKKRYLQIIRGSFFICSHVLRL